MHARTLESLDLRERHPWAGTGFGSWPSFLGLSVNQPLEETPSSCCTSSFDLRAVWVLYKATNEY